MAPFKASEVGKLMLSHTFATRVDAAPNRLADCVGAFKAMQADDFMLYEINSSSQAQCIADAAKAGKQISEHAHDFDFIGQTAINTSEFSKRGRIAPDKIGRFVRKEGATPRRGGQHDARFDLLRGRRVGYRPARCRSLHPRRVRPEGDPQRLGAVGNLPPQPPARSPAATG